jgi:hypothetical protein
VAFVWASVAHGSITSGGLGCWIGTFGIDQFEDLPILRLPYKYGFHFSCPLQYFTVRCGWISGRYTKRSFQILESVQVPKSRDMVKGGEAWDIAGVNLHLDER